MPPKNKIGIFLGSDPPSGGGQFHYIQTILNAARSLPSDRYEIVVACFSPAWADYVKERGLLTLPIKTAGHWKRLGDLWLTIGLSGNQWRFLSSWFDNVSNTLLREQCSLWIFPTQDSWASLLAVPSLSAIHDLMHRYEPSFPEVTQGVRRMFRDHYLTKRCRIAKGILVDSLVGRKHVAESYHVPTEKIFCLPYIPAQHIMAAQESPNFSSSYNLPTKFLFYAAQFWSHKNHINLIAAVDKVRLKFPDIHLVLVGSMKNGYKEVVKTVEQKNLSDHVTFAGYVPDADMAGFYKRARALIMPTFFGPTNIPPLEAIALDCPVATSDIYGMREQLGEAALWFDPKSVEQIARCIERLWSDDALCAALIQKGKEKTLSWGIKQFNETFAQIISRLV
jgi:glycosyltransferase involved in cell wall biosynthesis